MFKQILALMIINTISAYACQEPINIYEQEETTLYFKRPSATLIPGIEALIQKASFEKDNNFTVGEFALVKKDFLAAYNLKTSAGAKLVQIMNKKGNEYTFNLVTRKNQNGPVSWIEISVTDNDILGKIPQEIIPEELKQ